MKNLIIGLIIGIGGILLTSAYINQEESPAESGSIATVHVIEKATRVIIRTSIQGQEVSSAVNIDAGYVEKEDMVNFQPVLEELARLQAMGYELQNASLSTISYGKKSISRPYHAYVFIKK
jgi:hypothetical protein